jgi:hypothetical protein
MPSSHGHVVKSSGTLGAALVLFLLGSGLYAQPAKQINSQPRKSPNVSAILSEYEVVNPAVLDSQGCVDDYLKMRSLSGVAQRKLLHDLIQTSCLKTMEGIYLVTVRQPTPYKGFIRANLFIEVEEMKALLPKHLDALMNEGSLLDVGSADNVYVELKQCLTSEQFAAVKKDLAEKSRAASADTR